MSDSTLLRAFIAIPLPQLLLEQVATLQLQLRQLVPELRTPKAETLHLTLHFLGDLPQEQLAEIGRVMLSIGEKKKNFNVTLKGINFFPNQRRPRIVWLGVRPDKKIIELQQQLAISLNNLGLVTDQRRYQPHLTIGRFQHPLENIERLRPFLSHKCGSLKIDRMVLYTSELTAQGALHSPVTTAPLTGAEH